MKKSLTRLLPILTLLCVSMSLNQCACSGDTVASLFVSDADEKRLGDEFDTELRSKPGEYPLFTPADTSETRFALYADSIFQSLLASVPESERPNYDFKLTILRKNEVNAFAVPGGRIYLYTGIVKGQLPDGSTMKDESELAGVLAHEIAHVTKHHYRNQLVKIYGIQMVVDMLAGDQGQLAQWVGSIFTSLTQLQLSQTDEFEADSRGTSYLGASGRNARGIATLFARMGGSSGPSWLSTHPPSPERVTTVNKQVDGDASLKANDSDELRYQSRFEQNTDF